MRDLYRAIAFLYEFGALTVQVALQNLGSRDLLFSALARCVWGRGGLYDIASEISRTPADLMKELYS